jgi:hypothetical protein
MSCSVTKIGAKCSNATIVSGVKTISPRPSERNAAFICCQNLRMSEAMKHDTMNRVWEGLLAVTFVSRLAILMGGMNLPVNKAVR